MYILSRSLTIQAGRSVRPDASVQCSQYVHMPLCPRFLSTKPPCWLCTQNTSQVIFSPAHGPYKRLPVLIRLCSTPSIVGPSSPPKKMRGRLTKVQNNEGCKAPTSGLPRVRCSQERTSEVFSEPSSGPHLERDQALVGRTASQE